jgi:dihydroneopterin aldolase
VSKKDKVLIEGLKVDTVIGVFDWEREIKQSVLLDIEMSWNNKKAASSDRLEYALDYNAISLRLIDFIENSSFQLIETLAEHVAELLLAEFNIPELTLKVSKPGAVKAASNVAVKIKRKAGPANTNLHASVETKISPV